MRNNKKIRLFALILSLALVFAALPLSTALAADPDLQIFNDKTAIVTTKETDYIGTRAGHVGDEISFYVPVVNTSGGDLTDLTASIAVSRDANPVMITTCASWLISLAMTS